MLAGSQSLAKTHNLGNCTSSSSPAEGGHRTHLAEIKDTKSTASDRMLDRHNQRKAEIVTC